jgi:hypothetical protein
MSLWKDFSDAIYGIEQDGRYVTESRLKRMITMEGANWKAIEQRKHNKMFLVMPILLLQLISLNNLKATDRYPLPNWARWRL